MKTPIGWEFYQIKSKKKRVLLDSISWIEPKALCVLSNMLPCITSLMIHNCTDAIFRSIYSSMKNLEVLICLKLVNEKITEEAFTGIQTKRLDLLENSDMEITTEALDDLRQYPAITSLKSKFLSKSDVDF